MASVSTKSIQPAVLEGREVPAYLLIYCRERLAPLRDNKVIGEGRLLSVLRRILQKLGCPPRYHGRRGLGQTWESLAERRLAAAGYVIRERNYRGLSGEIDLVAEDAGVLCFVEVKGKSGVGFGSPEEAVTLGKQRRIARVALDYLRRRRLAPSTPCRFDVVAVFDPGDGGPSVEIHRDAFPLPERLG
jgi:putative endonuclease